MRILLVNGMRIETSRGYFDSIAEYLRSDGFKVDLIHEPTAEALYLVDHDLVVSHIGFPDGWRPVAGWYGGYKMARPDSLRLLEDAGIPTMDWTTAANRRGARLLFDQWDSDLLLIKRSGSYRRRGTMLLGRRDIRQLKWNPKSDVFCKLVNTEDGDTYKVELFAGQPLIAFHDFHTPLTEDDIGRPLAEIIPPAAIRTGDSARERIDVPDQIAGGLTHLAQHLMAGNLGYFSVEFMKRPGGEFVAIELNPRAVAVWWSCQFEDMPLRYAAGIKRLASLVKT